MKKRISSFALVAVLMLALVLVPMFAFSASAADPTATITFDNTSKRTEFTTSVQVWEENGIIVTNNKASGSNISDYSKPARFYANTELIIKCTLGNIKKIVFDANNTSYATVLNNSIDTSATVSVSNDKVTVTLDGSSDTFTISKMTAQSRVDSITVTYAAAQPEAPACEHTSTSEVRVEPTKTTPGSITETCDDCQTIVSTETLPPLGCKVTFNVPEGVDAPATQTGVLSVKMPSLSNLTKADGYAEDYIFAGWTLQGDIDGETTSKPTTLYKGGETVTLADDTTFRAVYMRTVSGGSSDFVLTDVANIKDSDVVVIVYTKAGVTYAITNNNGTGNPPVPVAVTVSGNIMSGVIDDDININDIKWNISYNDGNLTIYPNGSTATWLYCTSTNNGVRVGTNANKTFVIDSASGYLKHNGTSRYLGIYNTQDLRCYTSASATNIANQSVAFYAASAGTDYYCTAPALNTGCSHDDTTETRVEPTCTEKGSVTVTCNGCGEPISFEELNALGHDWNDGVVAEPSTCTKNGLMVFTCERDNCGETREEIIKAGHNFVDDVCKVCGKNGYEGRYYIATIRSSGNYWYMTSDLGTASTKRYQAVDSGLTALPGMISAKDKVSIQVFVLEKDDDGTYYIYAEGVDDNNYLGWSSDNSGILVAKEDAKKFTVDLNENGTFHIYFVNGTETRYLQLNSQSVADYFAFYTSNQKKDLSLVPVEDTVVVDGTQVELGSDLSLYYNVTLADGLDASQLNAIFTVNGKEQTVEAVLQADGRYLFKCTGIGPHQMGDIVKAEFYYDGELVLANEEWSIVKNLKAVYEEHPELKTLIADTLNYGAAAQKYRNPKIADEELVNYGFDGIGSDATPDAEDNEREYSPLEKPAEGEPYARVKAFGVQFDYLNKVYFKIEITDRSKFVVKLDGNEAELVEAGDNLYIVYTDGLNPTEYGKVYTLTIENKDGSKVVQTATYSLNSYVYAMKDDAEMGELALALYKYGKSAAAYANA